jgi:hypothetical protein
MKNGHTGSNLERETGGCKGLSEPDNRSHFEAFRARTKSWGRSGSCATDQNQFPNPTLEKHNNLAPR